MYTQTHTHTYIYTYTYIHVLKSVFSWRVPERSCDRGFEADSFSLTAPHTKYTCRCASSLPISSQWDVQLSTVINLAYTAIFGRSPEFAFKFAKVISLLVFNLLFCNRLSDIITYIYYYWTYFIHHSCSIIWDEHEFFVNGICASQMLLLLIAYSRAENKSLQNQYRTKQISIARDICQLQSHEA
jgi:hypothetical protein